MNVLMQEICFDMEGKAYRQAMRVEFQICASVPIGSWPMGGVRLTADELFRFGIVPNKHKTDMLGFEAMGYSFKSDQTTGLVWLAWLP